MVSSANADSGKKKKQSAGKLPERRVLEAAFRHMATSKAITDIYEANFKFASKYVHATSR